VAATYQLRCFLNHNIDGKLAANDQYQERVGRSPPFRHIVLRPQPCPGAGADSIVNQDALKERTDEAFPQVLP
jgi:hypothetical protein